MHLDWSAAQEGLRPEIVTIVTPADTHRAIVEFAAGLGFHIVCEKTLTDNRTDT